uniref:DEAD/DEAH box helicase n=1 Tax=Jeotgalibaca porci TaxID=1868793 RepID=UPI0035A01E4F
MTYKLHDYQQNMVSQTRGHIANGAKGVLIQSPPGSGKSIVIAEIAKLATNKKNNIMFLVHRKELADQIADTFRQHEVNDRYVTIMTVGKVANRLGKLPKPSIIITDETHHSRASTYRKIYDYYDDAIRLGFTATPWRMSGKGFLDIYDVMVDGKSVDWLIGNKFLAPYEYYAPTLADVEKLNKSSTGDYTKQSMDESVKAIYGDVVSHYNKLAAGEKSIVYAHSIEASKRMALEFQQAGINAVHADSLTPPKERAEIMNGFKEGTIQVLCNVDLISEGFNVPDCSCVIMIRPTASLVLYLQQAMRSMRYQPNKKAIIIDHVGNYMRHGLPNTDRQWTLEDVEKSSKKKDRPEDLISLTSCPHCFGVIQSGSNPCPLCNFEIVVEAKDLEVVDVDLNKIDQVSFQTDYRKIRIQKEYANKKTSELNTIEDFYLYAKSRGYKDSWIKFQHYSLQNLSFPEFYMKLKPLKNKYAEIFN